MSDPTMTGGQIGSVISLTGSVWAVSGDSQRPLSEGAPVYEGEEIVTESDSNVEIKFADDTILGQGEDSATRLDDYVFDGEDGSLDFQMMKGVMRVVSGEIVKVNPEGFNLSTPLATIGIRGTQVMIQVDQGREFIGVDQLGEGHTVLIANAFNQIVIDKAGLFSGVDFDGSLIAPDEMPDNFITTITRAAPLTTLGDEPRMPGDPQGVTPPQFYETIDNQTGEYQPGVGMEYSRGDPGPEEGYEEEIFELTEEEIEALLAVETAGGTEDVGGQAEELPGVTQVTYDPFDHSGESGQGDQGTTPAAAGAGQPDSGDEDDAVPDPVNEPVVAAAPPVEEPASEEPPPEEPPAEEPPPEEPPVEEPPVEEPPVEEPPSEEPPVEEPPVEEPPVEEPPAQDTSSDTGPTAEDVVIEQTSEEENSPVSYNVISQGDASGEDTTLVSAGLPDDSDYQGVVSYTPEGSITYVPAEGETGTVVVDYTVQDDDGQTASAHLTIDLAPDSQPTLTVTDATGQEVDGVMIASGSISTDYGADVEGSSLYLSAEGASWYDSSQTLIADDASWAIELTEDGYEYSQFGPIAGAENTAPGDPLTIEVTVTAVDGDGSVSTGDFTVTVDDDGPTATDAVVVQATEDTEVSYNVLSGGEATTGLFAGSLVDATLAEGSRSRGDIAYSADGTITYAPADGESGQVDIVYTVADADGDTASALLTVTLAADSEPVITVSDVSGDESDGLVTASGTFNVDFGADAEGATYSLSADNATWDEESETLSDKDGNWTIALAEGGYVFTQINPFTHEDTTDPNDAFTIDVDVLATDADGSTSSGSFSVVVDDDGPTAGTAELTQEVSGDTVTYNVFDNGSAIAGLDGATLTSAALTPDSEYGGTVTFDAEGNVSYAPAEGESGTVTIDYTVTDGDGDTATSHLAIDLAEPYAIDDYIHGQGGEVIVGGDGNDTIDGAQGKDVIFGTAGDDELIGGNSPDAIFGGEGDDALYGGKGNDILYGEDGNDTLSGGKGSDTFVFTSPDDGEDVILDFNTAKDHIQLYEATFDLSTDGPGNLADNQFTVLDSADFADGHDFQDADSGLIYVSDTGSHVGALYYDPNDTISGDETLLATVDEADGEDLSVDNIDIV